jgi:hypothetical protein
MPKINEIFSKFGELLADLPPEISGEKPSPWPLDYQPGLG